MRPAHHALNAAIGSFVVCRNKRQVNRTHERVVFETLLGVEPARSPSVIACNYSVRLSAGPQPGGRSSDAHIRYHRGPAAAELRSFARQSIGIPSVSRSFEHNSELPNHRSRRRLAPS